MHALLFMLHAAVTTLQMVTKRLSAHCDV